MRVTLEVKNREEVIARIGVFDYDVHKGIGDQLDQTTKNIRNKERQRAPIGKTKKYKTKIGRKFNRGDLAAKVGPMFKSGRYYPLAHLLEYGTAPHPIHPYGNEKVTVTHPGTKARPHIEPTWAEEEPAFIKGVENAIKGAAK